jgi:mRNA interferase MazF
MSRFNRREVWLTDLGMAAKVRPCLIASIPATLDDRALVCLVPHTTAVRNSRFEVPLKIRFLKPGAFDVQNIVTVPHVKLIRKLGELTEQEMEEINDRLKFWLNLD